MTYKILGFLSLLALAGACATGPKTASAPARKTSDWVDASLDSAATVYKKMIARHNDPLRFPRTFENGKLVAVTSNDWTSGFYSGTLWYLFEHSKDQVFADKAKEYMADIARQKDNVRTHDLGFMLYCSFGNGLRLKPDDQYKDVLLQGARSLSTRYNDKIGSIKSWDWAKDVWAFPVIIDNMMNLELLFWASKTSGDPSFRNIALRHARTTMANHYRADSSCYHVVDYDPETGRAVKKITHQGVADESEWARGQAWGLYGFTLMLRETGEPAFRDMAEKIAAYWMRHPAMPKDRVPYWDFEDPAIPAAPRDASAAAIAASALIELGTLTGKQAYIDYAAGVLKSLASPGYASSPSSADYFILKHATGNKPKNSEVDVPLNYADYYFVEGLLRLKKAYGQRGVNG